MNLWSSRCVRPDNRNDVKPSGLFQSPLLFQPCQSDASQFLLFSPIHGLKRLSQVGSRSRLDFDKHDAIAIQGNDVDLAEQTAVLPMEDTKPFLPEELDGSVLAAIAE